MSVDLSSPHLDIEDLHVRFKTYEGEKEVLNLARLQVARGEAVGVVGESGSGKSVLALTVLRLLRCPPAEISSERLAYDSRDLHSLSEGDMRRLRGREIAMIFQDPMSSLNPVFTVGSQLCNVIRRISGEKGKRADARALEYIRLVGLPDAENMLTKYPHQLSGGQRQRVIIALALCCDAKLIIADEPTRNLDVTVQAGILKTIAHLRCELGVSLLFIANNLGLVSAMCDRVVILLGGRIVESGTVDEVVRDPRHPYTHMLLRAIPTAEERQQYSGLASVTATAMAPSGVDALRSACPFLGRCADQMAECAETGPPELTRVGGTHQVACPVVVREEVVA